MESYEAELIDSLHQMAEVIVWINDSDGAEYLNIRNEFKKQVYDLSIVNRDIFFEYFDKIVYKRCDDEKAEHFLKEATLHFFIFTLKKLVEDLDFPNDKIDKFASHLSDKILSCKKEEGEI